MPRKVKAYILDAFAIMAYWDNEPSGQRVEEIIDRAHTSGIPLVVSCINLGEIYYTILRESSAADAERAVKAIHNLGMEIVPADWPLTHAAAEYKAKGGISYADCFALALATTRKGELVTGDPEFKAFESEVKILWL